MTQEPDEALLWAREDYAKQFRSRRSHVADSILSGFWDGEVEVRLPAHGYRAGAAASAERIKALEARVRKLEWVLRGMIAAASNNLPDRSKQHNLEVALEVLKDPDQ
ncbi:MAG: hypothetical protein IM647_11405 [Phenylobacterium sp.]|uniref:hypothetical protein n=1 Tax=Phenylobacterium sp. TaxID=1871053 RepID=UPI0025EDDFB7|nr:hypothetical protein [Phenylobacterium sp.]MCA6308376.1 hypothetical protein [Phenylobacterium sp.]MCA6318840.1 hypothetical protein [Phenylobacterium sp.]